MKFRVCCPNARLKNTDNKYEFTIELIEAETASAAEQQFVDKYDLPPGSWPHSKVDNRHERR
jgi:hypothetical protein